jgi:hypothetical protein
LVSNDTCWTLIIIGLILTVISAVVLYGGFYALPAWALTLAGIALTIGVICLALGIVLLIANYVRGHTERSK